MIKVRIQAGHSSIEVDGEYEEVEKVLATYWSPDLREAGLPDPPIGAEDEGAVSTTAQKKRPKRKNSRPPSGRSHTTDPSQTTHPRVPNMDAEAVANAVKTHPDVALIKAKILDVPADWINKCRLVAWMADSSITSGDVHRVLLSLRIKSQLPRLSEALSKHSTDFITQGHNPTRYQLTKSAEDAFLGWLRDPKVLAA